jgi:outer membrane protein assembly factor BamA
VNLFRVEDVLIPLSSLRFRGAAKLGEGPLLQASQRLLAQNYSRTFLEAFIGATLLPLYRVRGYLRAEFLEPEVEYLGEAQGGHPIRITIPVEEGEVYRVREVRWVGNQVLTAVELQKHVSFRAGEVADVVKLDEELERIREEEYGGRGYVRARLGVEPELDDDTLLAALTINVSEGDLYRFHALVIHGLAPTASGELRRRWKLEPGRPFDANYLRKFMKEDVDRFMKRLTPAPRSVGLNVNPDDEKKTVTVVLSFR